MTTPARTHWAASTQSTGRPAPQRLTGTQSPVLSSGGYTILASEKGISGLVYWVISIGGVHCCQYGPSPRVKVMVPFHPSNLFASSALTRSSPLSLLAALIASASS